VVIFRGMHIILLDKFSNRHVGRWSHGVGVESAAVEIGFGWRGVTRVKKDM